MQTLICIFLNEKSSILIQISLTVRLTIRQHCRGQVIYLASKRRQAGHYLRQQRPWYMKLFDIWLRSYNNDNWYSWRQYNAIYCITLQQALRSIYVNDQVYCVTVKSLTQLTHWGRVTHICVSKLSILGSDNGLSPGRRQAIIWTNARVLLIYWTIRNKIQWHFNRNWYIFIQENAFENVLWKMATILSRPQCVKVE